MMANFKQLQAFLAVAEHKSFSHAAKMMDISQPSLSRMVKELEDNLGVMLFDRYQRPLKLTEAGVFFQKRLQTIFLDLDNTMVLTKQLGNPKRDLKIGFVPSILYGLLPNIIAMMKEKRPNLQICLKDISSYQQIDALKTGKIDVGLGRFAHYDGAIRQILLRHERYVVALPNTHKLADREVIRLQDIVADTVILYHQTHLPKTDDRGVTEPLLHIFAEHGLTPLQTTMVSDLQVALGLVAAGLGVTLVPDSLKTVRHTQISYVTLLHENATSPIYLHTLTQPHPEMKHLLAVIYHIYEEKGITYRRVAL